MIDLLAKAWLGAMALVVLGFCCLMIWMSPLATAIVAGVGAATCITIWAAYRAL